MIPRATAKRTRRCAVRSSSSSCSLLGPLKTRLVLAFSFLPFRIYDTVYPCLPLLPFSLFLLILRLCMCEGDPSRGWWMWLYGRHWRSHFLLVVFSLSRPGKSSKYTSHVQDEVESVIPALSCYFTQTKQIAIKLTYLTIGTLAGVQSQSRALRLIGQTDIATRIPGAERKENKYWDDESDPWIYLSTVVFEPTRTKNCTSIRCERGKTE